MILRSATVCAVVLALASIASGATPVALVTPKAMAAKIIGPTPQLGTSNVVAPSSITSTVCQGLGAAHQGKFATFRCVATYNGGKANVWARALPGGKFCASSTGLESCPPGPTIPGDPRICHLQSAPPTADPNSCALGASEVAVTRAMPVAFSNPTWTARNVSCSGKNLTWTCEFSSETSYGTYYKSTIKFSHVGAVWTAALSTLTEKSTAPAIACTVHPAAAAPAGKTTAWFGGPPATCP